MRGRSGSTTLATYAYNELNQRIRKAVPGESAVTTDFCYYYNEGWQVLEEQHTVGGSTASYAQYVWDPRYIDAPVCRFRDADGSPDDGLEEVLYYTQDANCNVTALVNTSGGVVERYTYDAYGKVTFRQNDWSLQAVQGSLPAGAASAYDNQILFGGYRFDPESGLYHVRNRPYHPTLGVWPVRDPAGYVDGFSLYQGFRGDPINGVDPSGAQTAPATTQSAATTNPSLGNKYGKWEVKQTNSDMPKAKSVVHITFIPTNKCLCEGDIAFIQIYRNVNANNAKDIISNTSDRASANGWTVDKKPGRKSGWYAYNDDDTTHGNTITPGTATQAGRSNATLDDNPDATYPGSNNYFETFAICKKSKVIYAGVSWGFHRDDNGKVTSLPTTNVDLTKIGDFTDAVAAWDTQAARPDEDPLKQRPRANRPWWVYRCAVGNSFFPLRGRR